MNRPKTLRERVGGWLFREEIGKLRRVGDLLDDYHKQGPAILSPATLERSLQEVDSQWMDLILRQRGYNVLIGQGAGADGVKFSEADRLRAVYESRRMAHYDVQTKRAIQSWTDFGFGQSITVEPRDDSAKDVWDEFAKAQRNSPLLKQRKIQSLSNDQLKDGELFFVCYISVVDGLTTLRRFKTTEIARVVYQDDDQDIPLFYVRNEDSNEVLYPDWQVPDDVITAYASKLSEGQTIAGYDNTIEFEDGENEPATRVKVIHAAFEENDSTGEIRGWPPFIQSFPWSRAYKQMLEDRATINKWLATFVDELVHKGGSRANQEIIDAFATQLSQTNYFDNNPPAASGSVMVHNDQIERKRQSLASGAGDAKQDSMSLLGQVSAGDGVPQMWRGRPDVMSNRATAQELQRPWLESMQRYQTFWIDVFSDIATVVFDSWNEYGAGGIDTFEVDVILQSPFMLYPDEAGQLLGAITSATGVSLEQDVANRAANNVVGLALSSLGIQDPLAVIEGEDESDPIPTGNSQERSIKTALENYKNGNVSGDTVVDYLISETMGV